MNIERREQIFELRKQNKTIPEICKILNIGKGTVAHYLKKPENKFKIDLRKFIHLNFSEEIKEKIKISKINSNNKKILEENFDNLSFDRLRKRIILEQEGKCNNCKLNEWLGNKIILEIDHKDGNHKNNSRENLEALCPNCHSLTPTWRGRNKENKKIKVSDDELIESLIKNKFNLRQSLLEVGLSPKGGNYKRCYKLIKEIENIL